MRMIGIVGMILVGASVSAVPPFAEMDTDKDGKLGKGELPAHLRKHFEKIDADKDGFISKEEDRRVRDREAKRRASRKKPASAKTPIKARTLKNLDYVGDGNERQMIDLYLPEAAAADGKRPPLVVFVHGGGWWKGDRATGEGWLKSLVESGDFAGATIGYRLSNEAIWPSQAHDCKAAIRWLRANADKYGYDGSRMAVWGTSAGGHLVSMLGTSAGNAELEGTLGAHTDVSSKVQAVVNFFGPTRLLPGEGAASKKRGEVTDSAPAKLFGGAPNDRKELARSASPLFDVSKDDAPMIHFHGTKDGLVPFDQSVAFHAALEKADVESALITMEGAGHGFQKNQVLPLVTRFVRAQLLGEGETPKSQTVK